jgi:hypothetical protein
VAVSRVPALLIDAVDAPELQPPALERLRQGADHAAILPLVKAPHGRRKHERSGTGMTELEQLHVAAQGRAVPAVMFSMHFAGEAETSDVRIQISESRHVGSGIAMLVVKLEL